MEDDSLIGSRVEYLEKRYFLNWNDINIKRKEQLVLTKPSMRGRGDENSAQAEKPGHPKQSKQPEENRGGKAESQHQASAAGAYAGVKRERLGRGVRLWIGIRLWSMEIALRLC